MQRYELEDLEIIFDRAGRNDWGKFSFPVWYGIPVKVSWRGYEFDFNLRGALKRITGGRTVWPDPGEILKRTDGDDFIYYYGADGYSAAYDLIKNYYVPYNGWSDRDLFAENPLAGRHVGQALAAFDSLISRADELVCSAPPGRMRDFLTQLAFHDRCRLRAEAERLHQIIGGRLPVLPPDTIDVDYEVIPLIVAEGCSYNCRFCRFKTAGGFQRRSWDNILGQIEGLSKYYGADIVNYNSLVLGQNNALAAGEEILVAAAEFAYEAFNFAASYHRGRPNLFLFGSVDALLEANDSLFDRLERLPYHTTVNVGLEALDQDTLDLLGKPLRPEKIHAAFRKLLAINRCYDHVTVSCNFVLGRDLPRRHMEAVKALLSGAPAVRGKGVVYLSPMIGAAGRRQTLKEFSEIKMNSLLPVYLYLAQRL